MRSGFYGQNWTNDWCHSFDCGPDLNLTSISTVRGVEIGEIRVLSALLDGEISILVAFATKIVKQHP